MMTYQRLKALFSVLYVAAACLVASPALSKQEYLDATIKKAAYRQSWERMLKGQRVDAWLATFSRTHNGVVVPIKKIVVDGVTYEAGNVCKPHDCGGNSFYVLFSKGGRKAWGMLHKEGTPLRYFGSPTPSLKAALVKLDQGPW